MTILTQETILKTRQWFADNKAACIAEVKSGAVTVNNPEKYIAWCEQSAADSLAGKFDNNLGFLQRATFIQTGICAAILP